MANEVDYSPCKYTGNGSTTEFSFNWKIFNATDVIVIKEVILTGVQTTLTYGTDYSVSFGEVAGHITLSSAPTSEYYVIISRNVSDHQSKTYSTSTGFQGSEIENSFDKVSCNLQELEYTLERAIKTQVGSPNLDMTLPVPAKGKTLKWNEAETGLENSTIDVDELESIANRLHASIDNIDTVADDITNVNTVAAISDDVIVVSNSISNVNAVGESISNVNSVAADLTNIDTVSGDLTNIDTVADSISNVDAVGESIANVNAVVTDLTNIDTVADSISNVNAVGESISNVNLVAEDLTNIDAASDNAILAKRYAVGLPSEPLEGSAKYWAQQAATGQIQSDWEQSDNTKKDFIKNKPDLSLKQDRLISGTNIKTINSNSILGSGNLTLNGLPSQTGNEGKFLTTDGTDASWAEVQSGSSRNIGEIVASTIPLTDAGLHLLDGALIDGSGIYSDFVDYIRNLYYNGATIYYKWRAITSSGTYTTCSRVKNPTTNDYYYSDYGATQLYRFTAYDGSSLTWQVDENGIIYYGNTKATLIETGRIGGTANTPPACFLQKGYKTFKQPTLTANGTMGGDSFAVEASSYCSSPDRSPYKSFDGSTTTKWGVNNTTSGWLTFYNPQALKVSSIVYTPSTDFPNEDGGSLEILGSNDNSTWISLWSGSYTANSTQTFSINSVDFYNYYKISITNGISAWIGLGNLTINAVEETIATPEEQWQESVTDYGVCGKFVYDSVNDTVRLPKITGFTEGTIDPTVLGDLVEAGLPSINVRTTGTGDNTGLWHQNYLLTANGSIARGDTGTSPVFQNFGYGNSIYGNSNTVQPQTIKVLYYIVIAMITKTDIQVDIDEIATDLNGKADVDLSNITPTQNVKNTIVGWGMPDYKSGYSVSLASGVWRTVTEPVLVQASWQNSNVASDLLLKDENGVLIPSGYTTGSVEGGGSPWFCRTVIVPANYSYSYNNSATIYEYPLKGAN